MADANGLPLDPRLQATLLDLMNTGANRTARTEPIHQAAMAMAAHMAPDYAQAAMGGIPGRTDPSSIPSPITTGANGGDGASKLLQLIAGALAGAKGASSGGNISDLIKKLASLFQHKPTPLSKPNPGGGLPSGNPFDNGFTGWAGPDGMDYNLWPGAAPLTPNVSTSESYSWPNSILNDERFLNSQWNGNPSDPSNGTGVGPGMRDFRGTGGNDGPTGTDWWNE